MAFDSRAYTVKYVKEHYDVYKLKLPKGAKADLKSYAEANDLSLNALILKALERQYHFNFGEYKNEQGSAK